MIFTFGSNEAGIHGAGAAKHSLNLGATLGVGFGRQGNTFAIPTKDWQIRPMEEEEIKPYVDRFKQYARYNPKLNFQVTAIGTGLGGHSHESMAKLFRYAPKNCHFDDVWKKYLDPFLGYDFWGTF